MEEPTRRWAASFLAGSILIGWTGGSVPLLTQQARSTTEATYFAAGLPMVARVGALAAPRKGGIDVCHPDLPAVLTGTGQDSAHGGLVMEKSEGQLNKRVLVVYASRHGATQEIAERIATKLREAGLETTLLPAKTARDVAGYDAFVIGGAAYYFHWLEDASAFVHRNQRLLSERATWLFTSGPLGTQPTDPQGQDIRVTAQPREFAALGALIRPRDTHVFFGVLDRAKLGFLERLVTGLPGIRASGALPEGDFRDWEEIDRWSETIVHELAQLPAGHATGAGATNRAPSPPDL